MGRKVGELSPSEIELAKRVVQTIGEGATSSIRPDQFVFFAAFDGTNNDANNVPRGEQSTNVGQLWTQVQLAIDQEAPGNVRGQYYPGPGTAASLPGSSAIPSQVTQEAINTADKAYNDFTKEAIDWLRSNPDADPATSITTAMTAFSRGANAAAVFSQLLYTKGLTDPSTGEVLIPPGQLGVSSAVIFDPVETGMSGNMTFAPTTENVAVIRADNEYRYMFPAADYSSQPGATTFIITGNHRDFGGGYDNGLGALDLEAATKFLSRLGHQHCRRPAGAPV